MTIQWGDVATWVSGLGTMAVVGFAAVQVLQLRRDEAAKSRVDLDGVAVTWSALDSPVHPDSSGKSRARYRFTAHNPGRLPITDVVIQFVAPVEMTRVHFDDSCDAPSRVLVLDTPVIAGGSVREWTRGVEVTFAERALLRDAKATIQFVSLLDGKPKTNVWGRR